MDFTQLALLRTSSGQQALAAAAGLLDLDLLAAATTLRRSFPPDLAAAALTQATLRHRAIAKFGPSAQHMLFTPAGLEQATRSIVAARRAARLSAAGVTSVADLGCGLGADLRAFTAAGLTAFGVDADPVTAACAAHNVPAATVACGDAQDFDLSQVDAVFCDPARRVGSKRVFRPSDYSPPWDWVAALPGRVPHTVLKLAPGIDQDLLPSGSELELVSVDGDVVEAAAWCGPLATVPRRATVISSSSAASSPAASSPAVSSPAVSSARVAELTGAGDVAAPVGPTRAFLYEPDGAVVRSHLIAELADLVDGNLADPTIAYIWSDRRVTTPLARSFEVDEVLPFSLKRLRAALRSREVGRLEILKRGSALDVQTLRKDLRLSGPNEASLILTRVAGAPTAVITH